MIARGLRYLMGTFLRLEAQAPEAAQAARARDEALGELQEMEAALSIHRPDSALSLINRAAGMEPVEASPAVFAAVAQALRWAEETGGAFDPTAAAGRRANWRAVRLDASARRIGLPAGLSLDLGGFAKGFALDAAFRRAAAVTTAARLFADFGGQLSFWSRSGAFDAEPVAIEDPRDPRRVLARFAVTANASVATSSQSQRPGHLLDPRTGLPARGAASATAVAPTAAEAEAWSTALFVAPDAALPLARARGIRAYLAPNVTQSILD